MLCGFRSPLPLRDSPGFSPGSLLTQPLHLVAEPDSKYKIAYELNFNKRIFQKNRMPLEADNKLLTTRALKIDLLFASRLK